MHLRRRNLALVRIDHALADNGIDLGKARSQLAGALADITRLEQERGALLQQRRTAATRLHQHAPDEEARRWPRWKPSRRAPS